MTDSATVLLVFVILWTTFGSIVIGILSNQLDRMETKLDMLIEHGHNLHKLECHPQPVVEPRKSGKFEDKIKALKDG